MDLRLIHFAFSFMPTNYIFEMAPSLQIVVWHEDTGWWKKRTPPYSFPSPFRRKETFRHFLASHQKLAMAHTQMPLEMKCDSKSGLMRTWCSFDLRNTVLLREVTKNCFPMTIGNMMWNLWLNHVFFSPCLSPLGSIFMFLDRQKMKTDLTYLIKT